MKKWKNGILTAVKKEVTQVTLENGQQVNVHIIHGLYIDTRSNPQKTFGAYGTGITEEVAWDMVKLHIEKQI